MGRRRKPLTLSPLAGRGGVSARLSFEFDLVERPPHPGPLPASGEREKSGPAMVLFQAKYEIAVSPLTSAG
jgi:hypothetical protein